MNVVMGWGRTCCWAPGWRRAGEKHRCGDGAPPIDPATERSGQHKRGEASGCWGNDGEIVLDYNGDADRVRKSVQTGADEADTTLYLVDDLNPTGAPQVLEELDAYGQVARVYTYGPQLLSVDQRMGPEASYGPHPR